MDALDPQAQALLALLVSRLGDVIPGQPQTYIGYKEAHDALNLEYLGPTYGESLKKQGLLALANWVLAEEKPAITGIIVDVTSHVPAKGYFAPYGKTEDDFDWWTEQVRLSKGFDWQPHVASAVSARSVVTDSNQVKASYWWDQLKQEKYWMEITDREDIGRDLNCPQTDDNGDPEGSYSLIKEIRPGDVVFHYSTRKHRIEGASVAGGPLEDRATTWIPHGRLARLKPAGVQRPGWWLPIYGFSEANDKLTLTEVKQPLNQAWIYQWINSKELEIQRRRKAGERKLRTAIAAPFQRYGGNTLRAQQGYLTKMPVDFVNRWTKLSDLVDALSTEQEQLSVLGEVYPFDGIVGSLDGAFVPKSDADYEVEIRSATQRRTRKHEKLLNEAATILTSLGATVSSPHPIDLLISAPVKVIVEAKIALSNPRYAIRHAVGQLHEYRYFLKHPGAKLCVLLEKEPDDALIAYVENELDLLVAWVSDGILSCGPSTAAAFSVSGITL